MTSHSSQTTTPPTSIAEPKQTSSLGTQQMDGHPAPMVTTDWQPAAEIRETADCIYVQLQLPGFEREDIEVQAFKNAIAIRGAHFPSHLPHQSNVLASEFCYGAFERVIQLPGAIAMDQVQAELSYGLLTISLVKVAEQ